MAKRKVIDAKIRDIIQKYIELLKAEGVKIEKVFLFGSYTHGTPKPWSDIDLCIVSPQFGRDNFEESLKLSKMKYEVDWRIEPHLYSPEDLSEKYDPLADQIRKYGINVI